jgi:hypothetical protein
MADSAAYVMEALHQTHEALSGWVQRKIRPFGHFSHPIETDRIFLRDRG